MNCKNYLIFRTPKDLDLPDYKACLENSEFKWMLYGRQRFDIKRFLKKEDNSQKYSVFSSDGFFIGFVQFFYKGTNQVSFLGGIAPWLFNSGIGLKACVCILESLFKKEKMDVITGVYLYNLRSLKMLKAIGFVETSCGHEKVILKLEWSKFNNNTFNRRILDKIAYEIVEDV